MDDNSDLSSEATDTFEKLLIQINAAEEELQTLNEQIMNQGVADKENDVNLEAKLLLEETKLLKKSTPEGFEDDEEIQYFLAVGHLEEQKKELMQIKEMSEHNIAYNANELKKYNQYIQEQATVVKNLEEELAKSKDMNEDGQDGPESEQTKEAKMTLESDIRLTRKCVKDLKGFLKEFIDKTANLDPNYSGEVGASIGYLLQALWSSFLKSGGHREYIHIEALQYDVQDEDLQQLTSAGILEVNPQDPKKIRMVDFTMRT